MLGASCLVIAFERERHSAPRDPVCQACNHYILRPICRSNAISGSILTYEQGWGREDWSTASGALHAQPSASEQLSRQRSRLVGERGGKHEIAVANGLLRLLSEPLRLLVLGAPVSTEPAVVNPIEIP